MHSHFYILTCSPVLSPVHVSHCCLCLLYFFLLHHMFSTLMCLVISYSCGKPPERHMFLHSPWVTVQLEWHLIQKSLSPHFYLLLNSFTTPVHPWPNPTPTRPLPFTANCPTAHLLSFGMSCPLTAIGQTGTCSVSHFFSCIPLS